MEVTTLLTLTCNPSAHKSHSAAFAAMSIGVNRLVKRIRRQWPKAEVQYFLIWERTKKGWPHAHLLLRAPFIPQAWLSHHWAELTGAPIVDIRKLDSSDAVIAYVAKYLTKDPSVPPGMKRYRFSQGFLDKLLRPPTAPLGAKITWDLMPATALEVARSRSVHGSTVQSHADGSFTLYPPGHLNAPACDSLTMWPRHG